jgi:hypothetical protein
MVAMITIGIIRNGGTYLSQHLRKNDYWAEGEKEVCGEWIGEGARALGLSGEVTGVPRFGVQEGLCFASILGAQACLLSCGVVLTVENATSAKERESELHVRAPNPRTDQTARVSEQWASFSGVVSGR